MTSATSELDSTVTTGNNSHRRRTTEPNRGDRAYRAALTVLALFLPAVLLALVAALAARGLKIGASGPDSARAVTHLDVDAAGIERAIAAPPAVLAGLGLAVKSTWDVGAELESGRLRSVLSEWPVFSRMAFYILYPAGKQLSPKVRAFADFLVERFGPPSVASAHRVPAFLPLWMRGRHART